MIGRVHFAMDGEPAEATLGDDGRWAVRCKDPRAAEVLADDLNVDLTTYGHSPAAGAPGFPQLHEAARRLGGRVEAPEPGPGTPGVLY